MRIEENEGGVGWKRKKGKGKGGSFLRIVEELWKNWVFLCPKKSNEKKKAEEGLDVDVEFVMEEGGKGKSANFAPSTPDFVSHL